MADYPLAEPIEAEPIERRRVRTAGKLAATFGVFGLALGVIAGFGMRSPPTVMALLAMSLVISAVLWEVVGGAVLGLAAGLLATPFLPAESGSLEITGVFTLGAMAVGAGIGGVNRRDRRAHASETAPRTVPDAVFNRALNPMLVVDAGGEVIERNDRAIELLGSVKHLAEVVHLDDLDSARAELERTLDLGESDGLTIRAVSWDKKPLPAQVRFHRIGPNRVWLEIEDHSEEAELERKLWEAEARYRYLIEDAIDTLDSGIVLLDRDRQVVWANRTLGYLFNLDRDELIGAELKQLLGQIGDRVSNGEAPERIQTAESDSFVFTLQDEAGERILEFRSIPVETERYHGGRIDHYIDLTEMKKLERELREKTERLEASNRKLEEFSHVVSHDLKQPLRTMQAFSQFLLEDYRDRLEEDGVEYLERLARSSERMKNLIDDLLKLSSIGTKREPMTEVDVGDLLEEVLEDLGALLEGVEMELPRELPTVTANRTRLGELFANLISNAVRYNDTDEGAIRVEIGWEEEAAEDIFWVSDNGEGIDPRYQERIFELFERLTPGESPESTGAGLAICKRIVEEHGGRIWLDSEPGEGSTFYVSLPKPTSVVSGPTGLQKGESSDGIEETAHSAG